MDADKNMNAVLEQTLQEIHSTIWGRFIDENNIMLDYTDPEGKISLPRFHGANCITPVFFFAENAIWEWKQNHSRVSNSSSDSTVCL